MAAGPCVWMGSLNSLRPLSSHATCNGASIDGSISLSTRNPRQRIRCTPVDSDKHHKRGVPTLRAHPGNGVSLVGGIQVQGTCPDSRLRLFSGSANLPLAKEIACYLGVNLGKMLTGPFADRESYARLEESVRGCDVFLIQPTCPPVNDNLMELHFMIDACRRASAKTITAVIPYFGYARSDRKVQTRRESIAAKVVANHLAVSGAHRILVLDIHSGQSVGFFDILFDQVYAQPVMLDYLASKMIPAEDFVVVSPDVGGVARARAFAKKLSDAPLAIVDKRRPAPNVSEVMNLVGDVKGKIAILVDDIIDTAGTITNAAALLHKEGARAVYACCTHGVFSPPAMERLCGGLFQEVIITNTIPVEESVKKRCKQLTVLSVGNLLAESIWRVHHDDSLSSMFG